MVWTLEQSMLVSVVTFTSSMPAQADEEEAASAASATHRRQMRGGLMAVSW
jgi:hypothetical protein